MSDEQDRPSVEWLTEAFHRSVKAGDALGVDTSLRLIAVQDPAKAQELYDALDLALRIARDVTP